MKMLRIIYNKLLPALFWIVLLLAFDSPWAAMLTLLCAALHEIGHILAALLITDGNISMPKAVIYGLRIDTGGIMSYKQELFIALGGPFCNIGCALASMPLFFINDYAAAFVFINLLTALSNLIPLRSYDGERALSAAVSLLFSPYLADTLKHYVSLAVSALGAILSLFLIGRVGEGYWIFGAFFVSLFNEILSCGKNRCINKKRE